MWESPWAGWWSGGLGLLARCPSVMHSIPERIGVPGAVALEYRWGLQVSSGAGKYVGRWAVRGHMVVAAEGAYTEGKAGDEAVCWAHLWPVVDSDGKVGFWGGSVGTGMGSGIGCSG